MEAIEYKNHKIEFFKSLTGRGIAPVIYTYAGSVSTVLEVLPFFASYEDALSMGKKWIDQLV